jgi:hypothetical protein
MKRSPAATLASWLAWKTASLTTMSGEVAATPWTSTATINAPKAHRPLPAVLRSIALANAAASVAPPTTSKERAVA